MYICRVYLSHQDLIHTRRVQLRVISKYIVCLRMKKPHSLLLSHKRLNFNLHGSVVLNFRTPLRPKRKRGLVNIFVATF